MHPFSFISTGEKEAAITLLFIHGNSQSKANFLPLMNVSSLSEYRKIALDLPGHGESLPLPQEDLYSLSTLDAYVRNFISTHELTNVILLGHSLGGHVCIRVALNNPRVVGLMTWGTPPLKGLDSLAKAFLPSAVSQLLFQEKITEDDAQHFSDFSFSGESQYGQLISQSMLTADPRFRSDILQTILAGDLVDETQVLGQLDYRVLILCGEDDSLINSNYIGRHLVEGNNRHVFSLLSGHGHFLHLEDVLMFCSLIKNYAQTIGQSVSAGHVWLGE